MMTANIQYWTKSVILNNLLGHWKAVIPVLIFFCAPFISNISQASLPKASAAESAAFQNTEGPLSLIGKVNFWFDTSAEATLGSTLLKHQNAFEIWDARPIALNQHTGTLWLRIPLPSLTHEIASQWALHFSNHRIETINVYQIHDGTTISSTRLGRLQSVQNKKDLGFGYIVPLQGYDVPTTLLISISSQTPVTISPRMVPIELVQRLSLNTLLMSAFFPVAILAFWLILILTKQLSGTHISPVFWCIGPIFCLQAWVYSPISYYSKIFGTSWVWQKALSATPVLVGLTLMLGAVTWIDRSQQTSKSKLLFFLLLGIQGAGLICTFTGTQPLALALNWSLLLLCIPTSLFIIKKYHPPQDKLIWAFLGTVVWLPIALLELASSTAMLKAPTTGLSFNGLIALLSQTLFVIQLEKRQSEYTQRETKILSQQKKSLTHSIKCLEQNLALKHRFFQKVSEDIHKQLKELEVLKQPDQSPGFYVKSLDQLGTLALDIQRFCEIESGCLKLNTRRFDIKKLIVSLVETHSRVAEHKGLSFQSTVCSKLPDYLIGDPDILKQLLGQILDNAVKYTPKGEIKVVFKVQENRSLSLSSASSMVTILVKDTGPGLPENILTQFNGNDENLVESDTPQHVQHLGVGLTTAKQMAELMHGEIILSASPDQGTRCEVNIPMIIDAHHHTPVALSVDSKPTQAQQGALQKSTADSTPGEMGT